VEDLGRERNPGALESAPAHSRHKRGNVDINNVALRFMKACFILYPADFHIRPLFFAAAKEDYPSSPKPTSSPPPPRLAGKIHGG